MSKLKLLTGSKQPMMTRWGVTLRHDTAPNFPAWTPLAKELAPQVMHYFNFPYEGFDITRATQAKNIIIGAGAKAILTYPIQKTEVLAAFPALLDQMIALFGPSLVEAIEWDAETINVPTGSGVGMTDAQYIARTIQAKAHAPNYVDIDDTGLMYKEAFLGGSVPNASMARNIAIAAEPSFATDPKRQYRQVHPDLARVAGGSLTSNQAANLTLLQTIFNTTIPSLRAQLIARFGANVVEAIMQWHNEDAAQSHFIHGLPLGNWAIGKMIEDVTLYTKYYKYLIWMALNNLITRDGNREPEYISLARFTPAFNYPWAMPIQSPFAGVTGTGFWDGANGYGLLGNNSTATEYRLAKKDLFVWQKTVTCDCTTSCGYGSDLNAAVSDETYTDDVIIFRPHCGLFTKFTAD